MECVNGIAGIFFVFVICIVSALFIFGTVFFFCPIVEAMFVLLSKKGENFARQLFGDKSI